MEREREMKRFIGLFSLFWMILICCFISACAGGGEENSTNSGPTPDDDAAVDDDAADDDATDDDAADDEAIDDDAADDDTADDDAVGELGADIGAVELIAGGGPGRNGTALALGNDGTRYLAAVEANQLKLFIIDPAGKTTSEEILFTSASGPALAIDEEGNLHIAFYNPQFPGLYYGTNSSGAWQFVAVHEGRSPRFRLSLALDSAGRVHIAYEDGEIKYASNSSGEFIVEHIEDCSSKANCYPALALDSTDHPHVAYCRLSVQTLGCHRLVHAYLNRKEWAVEDVNTEGEPGYFNTIAVDAEDHLHIASQNEYMGYIEYNTNASGAWVTTSITQGPASLQDGVSLAVDAAGVPDVAFLKFSGAVDEFDRLYFARLETGAWDVTAVDVEDYYGFPALKLDEQGRPSISYFGRTTGALRLASLADEAWSVETVRQAAIVDGIHKAAMDQDGALHICFFEKDPDRLAYATNATGQWLVETVPTEGYLLSRCSIALDDEKHLYIGYVAAANEQYDAPSFALLASNAAGEWQSAIVSTTPWSGGDTAVAIEPSTGDILLSYFWTNPYNWWESSLIFARRAGDAWTRQKVDGGEMNGNLAYVLDLNGVSHFLFSRATITYDFQLFYASNATGGWTSELLYDGFGVNNFNCALTADDAGTPYLAVVHSGLQYVKQAGGAWQSETIPTGDGSPYWPSLILDNDARTRICYYDEAAQRLKYVTNQTGEWKRRTVDSKGDMGYYPVVALDPSGTMHVVYQGEAALWHATFR